MSKKTTFIIALAALIAIIAVSTTYYLVNKNNDKDIFTRAVEEGSSINIQEAAKSNTTK